MGVVFASLALVVWIYYLIVWARILVDATRMWARNWRPAGVAAVGLELVYAATEPIIRPVRRLCPPVRIGGISVDFSTLILLIAIFALQRLLVQLS